MVYSHGLLSSDHGISSECVRHLSVVILMMGEAIHERSGNHESGEISV